MRKHSNRLNNVTEELHIDSIDGGSEAIYRLGHVLGRGRTPTGLRKAAILEPVQRCSAVSLSSQIVKLDAGRSCFYKRIERNLLIGVVSDEGYIIWMITSLPPTGT